jgi:hypothetical protein
MENNMSDVYVDLGFGDSDKFALEHIHLETLGDGHKYRVNDNPSDGLITEPSLQEPVNDIERPMSDQDVEITYFRTTSTKEHLKCARTDNDTSCTTQHMSEHPRILRNVRSENLFQPSLHQIKSETLCDPTSVTQITELRKPKMTHYHLEEIQIVKHYKRIN